MTMEEFWKSWLAIWFMSGPFLLEFVSIGYSLYLTRRHMGAIKEALKNSRYIYIWGTSLGKRGWIWSLLEIARITQIILLPKASLQIGELDPGDLENFPPYLKRLLMIKMVMMVGCGVWLLVVYLLVKFC